jgi:flagellar assembly protein FliH
MAARRAKRHRTRNVDHTQTNADHWELNRGEGNGHLGMGALGEIEIFEYRDHPGTPVQAWEGWVSAPEAAGDAAEKSADEAGPGAIEARVRGELEQRLAEEARRAFESGRERGCEEGRHSEHEAQAAANAAREERQVRHAAALVESFTLARNHYLESVEQEVVRLALAVAARILRREAQMDPLLLTGAVRVALGQLASTTEVRLRVPAEDLGLWTDAIGLLPNLAVKPNLMAGEGMRLGDCQIETGMGSVDLGIRAQLGEIERGFFDRAGGPRAVTVLPEGAAGPGQEERA